jgi:hypothetical protein
MSRENSGERGEIHHGNLFSDPKDEISTCLSRG